MLVKSAQRKRAKFIAKANGYEAYLNSNYWKWMRKTLLPFKCLICSCAASGLHHISYRNLGYEKYNELIPLCEFCHNNLHEVLEVKYKNKKYISTYTKKIWPLLNRGKSLSVAIRESNWKQHFEVTQQIVSIKETKSKKEHRKLKNDTVKKYSTNN